MVKKKNLWIEHLKTVRKENPKADFKKIASIAKKSYKSKKC